MRGRLISGNLALQFQYYLGQAMKTLSLKVPDALERKLAAAVKHCGVSKNALVCEALSCYLDESRELGRGSFLDLAGNLFGCVKAAPADLSSNPRYRAGFGW